MKLLPSAHLDTFCRDNLPAEQTWPELSFDLPELQYPDRLNCATALLEDTIAVHGGDRPCALAPHETWSYDEVRRCSNRIANVLVSECGLVPGQRVLLRGPNAPWLLACWLGVLKAGGVVVTTMPLLRRTELATLIELTRPAFALCEQRFTDDLEAVAGQVRVLTYPGSRAAAATTGEGDRLDVLAAAVSEDFDAVQTSSDDVAMLAPTSGTTGQPKVTMHFHRDVLAIADTFGKYTIQATPDDIFTGTPPLAFTFGLGALAVFPLRIGASVLLLERATPAELAELIAEHRVSVLSTAPTAYRAILRSGKASTLTSLRRCVSAGEHLPEPVWQQWYSETGVKIINGLGSTEMLHVFIAAADEQIVPGATGIPVPGYQACVLDPAGVPVPDGQAGRLAVRGPTGCRYLSGDRQTVYVQDGWNLTGDTYIRDSSGYYWYQARSDDMIVSSGYNIGAPEVEWVLDQHPDVVESAVIGSPDPERGAVVHAFVVLRDGVSGDAAKVAELQAFAKAQIAPYKYPRRIDFVDALPRTQTGKLQRYRLRSD
ncbi:MAG TPA: AMP-binding protein [Jatrophihabitans sp.]|jgi:2-aminobenzoate-CoA ligase